MKPWRLLPFSTAVALGTLLPTRASAHLVNTDVGEFYAGMLHPLTSAEHLLPTLALALLAIQCGKRAARAALLAFPMALLVGTVAGSRLPPFAFFHVANLVALVGLGGLLALGDRLNHIRPAAVGALALLTGLILGYRSGIDMAASKVAAQFIPGVACHGAHRRRTGRGLGPDGPLTLRPQAQNAGWGGLRGGWNGAVDPTPDRRCTTLCSGGQAAGAGGSAGHAAGE